MAGKGVAEHMRRELPRVETGARRDVLQIAGEGLAGQMAARAEAGNSHFDCRRLPQRGPLVQIDIERRVARRDQRHQPLAPALALAR